MGIWLNHRLGPAEVHEAYALRRFLQALHIGLAQLDPDRWIEPDEQLLHYLSEKKCLLAEA